MLALARNLDPGRDPRPRMDASDVTLGSRAIPDSPDNVWLRDRPRAGAVNGDVDGNAVTMLLRGVELVVDSAFHGLHVSPEDGASVRLRLRSGDSASSANEARSIRERPIGRLASVVLGLDGARRLRGGSRYGMDAEAGSELRFARRDRDTCAGSEGSTPPASDGAYGPEFLAGDNRRIRFVARRLGDGGSSGSCSMSRLTPAGGGDRVGVASHCNGREKRLLSPPKSPPSEPERRSVLPVGVERPLAIFSPGRVYGLELCGRRAGERTAPLRARSGDGESNGMLGGGC